jgi:hypothetical protein
VPFELARYQASAAAPVTAPYTARSTLLRHIRAANIESGAHWVTR